MNTTSKITPKFFGIVTSEGKLVMDEKEQFARYIARFKGRVSLTIRKFTPFKQRSTIQNNYYWICITACSDYTGYTIDEMHIFFRMKYLKKHSDKHDVEPTCRSTTELSTKEFVDYVENVRMWASEHGVLIKDPEHYQIES